MDPVKEQINIIYLMGAGRSGTTALATFLGNAPGIDTLGELNQFHEHLAKRLTCPYGENINACLYWKDAMADLRYQEENSEKLAIESHSVESHKNIPLLLLGIKNKRDLDKYISNQEAIYKAIDKQHKASFYIDSSKYIGRILALRKSKVFKFKIIYVVRDPRGVIWSFKKKVQTSRMPLRTAGYYLIINFFGEIAYHLFKPNILKIRYEDLINNPDDCLTTIANYIEYDLSSIQSKIKNSESFRMPHIIGGNRLKHNHQIKFKQDISWRQKGGIFLKYFYYYLLLPLNLINRYKL